LVSDGTLMIGSVAAGVHDPARRGNIEVVAWEGMLYKSDGSPICGLQQGLRTPEQGTRIFAGDTADIAWTSDIRLDRAGRPYVAYSVRKVPVGAPPDSARDDHRYHYSRWNGKQQPTKP
jgi:hypothetical protein